LKEEVKGEESEVIRGKEKNISLPVKFLILSIEIIKKRGWKANLRN
jgi:hypothetical protein